MPARRCAALLLPAALAAAPVHAGDSALLNDLGGIGLLQTPTARIADEGSFGVGVSHVKPYNQLQLSAAPLPWMEAVFRYTDVTNRRYGPVSFSGRQSYKDRSFGLKLRLVEEGELLPAIAVGIQDFGGTGVFSGEYLVAGRRWYDLDFSLGLGWGRLGEGGHIGNPLGVLASHFDRARAVADSSSQTPGGSGFGRLFTGRTVGLFGGVQWQTPIDGLSLKLEFDGNGYTDEEGIGARLQQDTRINVGLDYAAPDRYDIGLGYERGNTFTFHFALLTNFERDLGPPKTRDAPPPEITVRDAAPKPPDAEADALDRLRALAAATRDALLAQGFRVAAFDLDAAGRAAQVWIEQDRYGSPAPVIGRSARALTATTPEWVECFTIIGLDYGVEVWRVTVLRKDVEKIASYDTSPEEIRRNAELEPPAPGEPRARVRDLVAYPNFNWDMGPGVRQQIGGPDGFYFGQIYWSLSAEARATENWRFSGEVTLNLLNNFGGIHLRSNSELPHVRSDVIEYLQQGQQGITKLETNYLWSPASQWYARVSAGIFEEMYAGAGSEILYRPAAARWALGLDANYVVQRGYSERFTFRNYRVATGHLNGWYELPWYSLKVHLSVGRYLAKDYGSTLELSREFRNGVELGAFATRTNVSAQKFGEGSFDKGFYISIPFDALYPKSSRRSANFLFRPLTRDGGQKVRDGVDLYGATDAADPERMARDWPAVMR
jgi:hypothetical protein